MSPAKLTSPRGSVLLVAMILLVVLTVVGVAAVSASTRERAAAGAMSRHDRLVACARAAQAKIWAEVAMQGPGYLTGTSPVTSIALPDGTQLAAPSHYDTLADGTIPAGNVTLVVGGGASGGQLAATSNLSNQAGISNPVGQVNRVTARCIDKYGHASEVELAVRFAF